MPDSPRDTVVLLFRLQYFCSSHLSPSSGGQPFGPHCVLISRKLCGIPWQWPRGKTKSERSSGKQNRNINLSRSSTPFLVSPLERRVNFSRFFFNTASAIQGSRVDSQDARNEAKLFAYLVVGFCVLFVCCVFICFSVFCVFVCFFVNVEKIVPECMPKLENSSRFDFHHPKSLQNQSNIGPKSIQNLSKIDKNASRAGLGESCGVGSAPGRSLDALGHPPGNSKVNFWSENVAQMADFGTPLGRQGAPEMVISDQKSTQNRQQIDPGWGSGKNMEI